MNGLQTKQVWVVWQNTDLTEGRGHEVPIAVCESRSSAIRLSKKQGVQGSDAHVSEGQAVLWHGTWLAPVNFIKPNKADVGNDLARAELQGALDRAKALGLTMEDLKVLSQGGAQ